MQREIIIDPITRLEGHGKISIFLDDKGDVDHALFQVPELRGFEAFCVGRLAEDMPQITSRICGICPSAHHMASVHALDDLYKVAPPLPAELIRRLFYHLFMYEDHLLHFYYLGAPDFLPGADAAKGSRNVLGLIDKVGIGVAKKLVDIRKQSRNWMAYIGGKATHPVLGLPGGVAKAFEKSQVEALQLFSKEAIEFAKFSIQVFKDVVLGNEEWKKEVLSPHYMGTTNYMGLVNDKDQVDFLQGKIKIVNPLGVEIEKFSVSEYLTYIDEHVEPWSYIKFPYLKKRGWKGFTEGQDTSLVRVAPLARLNTAKQMATPQAQEMAEELFKTLGGKPAHHTLAWHWARLVEVLQCAEIIQQMAYHPQLTDTNIRNMNLQTPKEGFGVVEAPRGTLIHHYKTDQNGVLTGSNLLVATVFNSAPICMSVEKAARHFIKNGQVTEGLLDRVEMAFRAYDPCLSCATHSTPGKMPLEVAIFDKQKALQETIIRDPIGNICCFK